MSTRFEQMKEEANAEREARAAKLKAQMQPVVFPDPPRPEDAPENLRRPDLIAEAAAPVETNTTRLQEATAGDLDAANDAEPSPRKAKPARKAVVERSSGRKSEQGRTLEGYKQLSGRVPSKVHLDAIIAAKTRGVDVGEIIAEALAMWHKKNDSVR